jgi:hypothetical protein
MTPSFASGMTVAPHRLVPLARIVGVALLFGTFLSATGALDTEAAPAPPRLLYWAGLALFALIAAQGLHFLLGRRIPSWDRRLLRALGWGVLVLPCTLVAALTCKLLFGGRPSLAGFSLLLPGIASILAAIQLALLLLDARGDAPVVQVPGRAEQVDRADPLPLPLPLRGARIEALQAEDHYVRVHTAVGQALIRMRMSDARAALAHFDGVTPHRSWWVARDAAVSLAGEDGRFLLTLLCGLKVPVSRGARKALGPAFHRPLDAEQPSRETATVS